MEWRPVQGVWGIVELQGICNPRCIAWMTWSNRDFLNVATLLPFEILPFENRSWLPFLANAKRTARFRSCLIVIAKRKNKKGMRSNKFQWLCFFFSFSGKCVFWFRGRLVLNLTRSHGLSPTTSFSIGLPDLVASLSTNPSLKKKKDLMWGKLS